MKVQKEGKTWGGSQDVPWALKWLPGYNKAAIVMTIVITGVNAMASINIRIDDELKARAYHALEKLGITPSELMRQTLQYVAERGQLPFRPVLMTEEDEAMIATVRDRLAGPQRVKVALDDL